METNGVSAAALALLVVAGCTTAKSRTATVARTIPRPDLASRAGAVGALAVTDDRFQSDVRISVGITPSSTRTHGSAQRPCRP